MRHERAWETTHGVTYTSVVHVGGREQNCSTVALAPSTSSDSPKNSSSSSSGKHGWNFDNLVRPAQARANRRASSGPGRPSAASLRIVSDTATTLAPAPSLHV